MIGLPLRASNRPSQLLYTPLKGSGRGCPLLRASDEHSFIVRVLRARRAPGRSFLTSRRFPKYWCQCILRQLRGELLEPRSAEAG